MFAINHAATALVLKRGYPRVSLLALLLSVQAMELLWVLLNFIGVERTTTNESVRTVADIHLAHMPYSHSVATMLGVAMLTWIVLDRVMGKRALGIAVGLGIASHLVLDLLTHSPDIALAPGVETVKLGLGLYSTAPILAFGVELAYGIACWWLFRGGAGLLAAIVLFNVANLSLFSERLPGPENWLAERPLLLTAVIFVQIVVTLVVVGWLARSRRVSPPNQSVPPLPSLISP